MPSTEQRYVASGVCGLDDVMGGGYPSGHLVLIRGPSGAGKTTLCLQFLIEAARSGEPALYLGTSETVEDIRRIARSHGWSLDGVAVHHQTAEPDALEQTMLHSAEIELPESVETMLAVIEQIGPARLVIDSLTEIRVLARDELWYRRQLLTLKKHFTDLQCTVLLTEVEHPEHSTLDSIVSAVVELQQTAPSYGPDRRRLRVNKIRGQDFATGFHDYKMRRGGIEVFPRLAAAEHRQRFRSEQISTGVTDLDAMFHGGLNRGSSVLLLGPSGTGKSVMVTQFLVAAAERGDRSAYYVFDERIQTLFQRSEGIGLPLQRHVDEGTIEVRQIDPAELTSGEFGHTVKELVENEGIQLLAIDSLNGYAYAMPEERMLSIHLHELISYLSQRAVTSILTMTQHGLLSEQTQQPFDVSYIADSVILFRPFELQGQIRKAVSVYKNRSGPHESSVRELKIGPGGIRVTEPLRLFRGILSGSPQFMGGKLDDRPRDAESAVG